MSYVALPAEWLDKIYCHNSKTSETNGLMKLSTPYKRLVKTETTSNKRSSKSGFPMSRSCPVSAHILPAFSSAFLSVDPGLCSRVVANLQRLARVQGDLILLWPDNRHVIPPACDPNSTTLHPCLLDISHLTLLGEEKIYEINFFSDAGKPNQCNLHFLRPF